MHSKGEKIMISEFYELKNKFCKIKKMEKIKSLRKGPTGVGYTFESLLGKKEDTNPEPDFKNIEIKCKLYYSKSPLSLFTLCPARNNDSAINYIFAKYSYHRYGDYNDYRLFERIISSEGSVELYDYSFKLDVDHISKKIVIKSYYKGCYEEDVCYWSFDDLKERIITKLSQLAVIKALPYTNNGEIYYKYVSIKFYHFENFDNFIKLIENNEICVQLYIREGLNKLGDYHIENHGVTFKIRLESIERLFQEISI